MGTPLKRVKGIGPSTERQLKAFGIDSAEMLAAATVAQIAAMPNFGKIKAEQLRQAAIDLLARVANRNATKPDAKTTPAAVEPAPQQKDLTPVAPVAAEVSIPSPAPNPPLARERKKTAPTVASVVTTPDPVVADPVPVVTAPDPVIEQPAAVVTPESKPLVDSAAATVTPDTTSSRNRDRHRRRGSAVANGNTAAKVADNPTPRRNPSDNRPQRSVPSTESEARPRAANAPAVRDKEIIPAPVSVVSNHSQINTCTMALFCDFENIALGTRDAHYAAFDIQKVLERLLLKGNIVVRKSYCDWERYKDFKAPMHEAAFELIEIPHVRQSGKNSADIRMVVDALDLCYTKQHLDTFVIISGDSDFTPLVTKLRENNKTVIGVGVKKSTSDLFTSNCDEFIFYDDLLRESTMEEQRRHKEGVAAAKVAPKTGQSTEDAKMQEALDLVLETVEDLFEERGGEEKVWGSMVKQAVKRRKPSFNERYHGFRTFSKLLEEAAARGMLNIQHDEKSGGYIIAGFNQDD